MAERKRLNLITGPSGAGKTVYCKGQPDWDHCLLNLDDFARALGAVDDHAVRAKAWTTLLTKADRRMRAGRPMICIDTVFNESDFADLAVLLDRHDYESALWVLSPALPETCAGRIAQRRSTGGHGRPELARELYESALSAASNFSLQCDSTYLVDTGKLRNQPIAWFKGFHAMAVFRDSMPQWVAEYFPVHLGKPTS